MLLPVLRRVWRDPHRVQVGTDPDRAVVLEFTDPTCARILDLLDGTRTETRLLREAASHGIAAEDATTVLAVLRTAGYVIDAHTLRAGRLAEVTRRRLAPQLTALALRGAGTGTGASAAIQRRQAARILITGAGPLAVPIGTALASAGVGHVHPAVSGITLAGDAAPGGLLPADEYRPRAAAAADAIRRVAPDVDVTPLRPGQATFAVLVGVTAPATLMALSYGRRRLPHLAVSVRDGTVVLGPLVRPGVTPCLNCLDLHRRDRDPGWPAVAEQISRGDPDAVEATTALAGAAYAAAEVLAHVDGALPGTLGATVEITTPGRPVRRQWTQHPECGCRRRRARPIRPGGCFN
jgi:bacteriocin biosynthesis cyclodehydratase domain-containing protein